MEPIVVFAALFVPTFVLRYLSAGRDQLTSVVRPRMHAGLLGALTVAALLTLHGIGIDWAWAVALSTSAVLGSRLGDWLGDDGALAIRSLRTRRTRRARA
jgi:hypothetical protein